MTGDPDALQLAASRQRFALLLEGGWPLSQVALASVGWVSTPEAQACQRALRAEFCSRASRLSVPSS